MPAGSRVKPVALDDPQGATYAELLADNARLRREVAQLRAERSSLVAALSNAALIPAERITGVFALFEVEHEKNVSAAPTEPQRVVVKALAGRIGLSEDATGKHLKRLTIFGLFERERRSTYDPATGDRRDEVWLRQPDSLPVALHRLATLSITEDERKKLTGRGKPGGIRLRCPACGSENVEVRCRDCGCITHAARMPENRRQGSDPQVAAEGTKPPPPPLRPSPKAHVHEVLQ